MLPFSTSKERLDIVVLVLFLVFFVDPLLPNRIAKAFQYLLFPRKEKKKE
jgi:hypothetical protein